ncbi:hypothetical protein BGX28_000602, partial [Mortierella sp. GBA30]
MISALTTTLLEHSSLHSGCSTVKVTSERADRPSLSTATVAQPPCPSSIKKYSAQFHKNGMPIKSAMKSPSNDTAKTRSSNALFRPYSIRSHSSPTPLTSPKYVHFNTQLEHVRLFLQGETPSCVAERETIVDARQHDRATSDIKLTLTNWTSTSGSSRLNNITSHTAPLHVECVVLSEDQSELQGQILVQNLAFHKHVSVRYTVDFWQTYSEVTAEFVESIPGTALDRFAFEVPLEMERSVIEKTFCMAVRYQVVGREFWDSNSGMNYQVECKRVVVIAPPTVSDLSKQMTSLLLGSPLPDYSKPVLKKKLANRYDLSSSLSAAYSHVGGVQARMDPFAKVSNSNSSLVSTSPTAGARKPSPPTSQTAYRPSEYIAPSVTSPQIYHHSLYASSPKFISTYLSAAASPPDYQLHLGFDPLALDYNRNSNNNNPASNNKKATRNSWNAATEASPPPPSPSPVRSPSLPANGYCSPYSSSPKSPSSAPISIPTSRMHANRPAVGSSSYFDL